MSFGEQEGMRAFLEGDEAKEKADNKNITQKLMYPGRGTAFEEHVNSENDECRRGNKERCQEVQEQSRELRGELAKQIPNQQGKETLAEIFASVAPSPEDRSRIWGEKMPEAPEVVAKAPIVEETAAKVSEPEQISWIEEWRLKTQKTILAEVAEMDLKADAAAICANVKKSVWSFLGFGGEEEVQQMVAEVDKEEGEVDPEKPEVANLSEQQQVSEKQEKEKKSLKIVNNTNKIEYNGEKYKVSLLANAMNGLNILNKMSRNKDGDLILDHMGGGRIISALEAEAMIKRIEEGLMSNGNEYSEKFTDSGGGKMTITKVS